MNWTTVIGAIIATIIAIIQATHSFKIEENRENHEVTHENIREIEGQIVELPYLRKEFITGIISELRQKDEAQDIANIRQDIRLDSLEREEHRHLPFSEKREVDRE